MLAIISLGVACTTKRKVVVAVPTNTVDTTMVNNNKVENLNLLKSKDVSFNTLTLRGKARIDFNGNVNNVSVNFRIKKDEAIWLSITAIAGIEPARALITPDSIKVMNKLDATYLGKPFSYVHRYTNNQVDFKLLQSILSGNTIGDFMVNESSLAQKDGVWELSGEKATLVYRMLFNNLLKVSETNLNDTRSSQALKVVYGDYQEMNGTLFPTSIKINSMAAGKRVAIDLDFSKIDSNLPVEFPFNVPGRYEVIH